MGRTGWSRCGGSTRPRYWLPWPIWRSDHELCRDREGPAMTDNAVILLLSGPNLNLLGDREPAIYGDATLADHVDAASRAAAAVGHIVEHVQSNHEGDLIEAVQQARGRAAAIVVNAGALTHTSWALHDALAAFDGVVVELHLSDRGTSSRPSTAPAAGPPRSS